MGAPSKRPTWRVIVVLPAYNEADAIERLLLRIEDAMANAALRYHVILINDGSTDGTGRIAGRHTSSMPITVVDHPTNLGLGTTIRDGLLLAARMAAEQDIVITMDADDTQTPELILRMAGMIREGHDVVIASRYQLGSRTIGVPLKRRLLSRCGSLLYRAAFPIPGVRDYTSGFRAYRAEVIVDAIRRHGDRFPSQDGFECMLDILLKLRTMSLVFGEVPFVLRYDYKKGATKMKVMRTTMVSLSLLVRRRLGL